MLDFLLVEFPSVSFIWLTDGLSTIRNEHWLTALTDRVNSRDPVGSKKLCTTLPPLPLKCFNNSNHFRAQEGLRCISQLSPSLPLVVTPDKVRPRNYHLTQTVEHLLQGQQHQDYHQYCQVSLQCHHYYLWLDIYHLMFYILHYWSCYTHLFITFLLFHGSPCANEKWICVYLFLSAFCWNW